VLVMCFADVMHIEVRTFVVWSFVRPVWALSFLSAATPVSHGPERRANTIRGSGAHSVSIAPGLRIVPVVAGHAGMRPGPQGL
jgi:hypothetical protein